MSVLLAAIQIGGVLGFFHLFAIGSYGFTVSEALLIVIAIILAYRTLWQGKPLYIPQSREMLASVLLWCAFAASTFAVLVSTRDQFIIQSAKSFFSFYLHLDRMHASCSVASVGRESDNRFPREPCYCAACSRLRNVSASGTDPGFTIRVD